MTAQLAPAPDLDGLVGLPAGARTIWAPAHRSNYYTAADRPYGGVPRRQIAICYHTPEEQPDDIETTPAWFQDPAANASTGYYADSDGDLYQMVRDADFAWAQGTRTRKRPNTCFPRPAWWKPLLVSYNTCMLSIEIEGWARSIGRSFTPGSRQFQAVAAWSAYQCRKYDIPLDRAHHLGHSELCTTKGDPGQDFPWDDLLAAIAALLKPSNIEQRLKPSSIEQRIEALERGVAQLQTHTHGPPAR